MALLQLGRGTDAAGADPPAADPPPAVGVVPWLGVAADKLGGQALVLAHPDRSVTATLAVAGAPRVGLYDVSAPGGPSVWAGLLDVLGRRSRIDQVTQLVRGVAAEPADHEYLVLRCPVGRRGKPAQVAAEFAAQLGEVVAPYLSRAGVRCQVLHVSATAALLRNCYAPDQPLEPAGELHPRQAWPRRHRRCGELVCTDGWFHASGTLRYPADAPVTAEHLEKVLGTDATMTLAVTQGVHPDGLSSAEAGPVCVAVTVTGASEPEVLGLRAELAGLAPPARVDWPADQDRALTYTLPLGRSPRFHRAVPAPSRRGPWLRRGPASRPAAPTPADTPPLQPAPPAAAAARASVVGGHGGAGVTTVCRWLRSVDVEATDRGVSLPADAGEPLVLVVRGTAAGVLTATRRVGELTAAGGPAPLVAVVGDGWPEPPAARARLRALGAHTAVVRLPWVQQWRYVDDPGDEPPPAAYVQALAQLRAALPAAPPPGKDA